MQPIWCALFSDIRPEASHPNLKFVSLCSLLGANVRFKRVMRKFMFPVRYSN